MIKAPISSLDNIKPSEQTRPHIFIPVEDNLLDSTIIGDKAVNLTLAKQIGCLVPEFTVIKSPFYELSSNERMPIIVEAIKNLERLTGKQLGNPDNPLIFSIREITSRYIPGYLPTCLCIGIMKNFIPFLTKELDSISAKKIYIKNLCEILKSSGVEFQEEGKKYTDNYENMLESKVAEIDEKLLSDPFYQTSFVINNFLKDFKHRENALAVGRGKEKVRPAFILQRMVWSIYGWYGVVNTRNPETGKGFALIYKEKIFGDEIMTGNVAPVTDTYSDLLSVRQHHPMVHELISRYCQKLEKTFKDGLVLETVAEKEKLYVLQINRLNKSPEAAFNIAFDLIASRIISTEEINKIIKPIHLKRIEAPFVYDSDGADLQPLGKGISILTRIMISGEAYFTNKSFLEALNTGKNNLIIIKDKFDPQEDREILENAIGFAATGNAVVHAREIALSNCLPGLYDLGSNGVFFKNNTLTNGNILIKEGEWVTISSKQGMLYKGMATRLPSKYSAFLRNEKINYRSIEEEEAIEELHKNYLKYKEIISHFSDSSIKNIFDLNAFIIKNKTEPPGNLSDLTDDWYKKNTDIFIDDFMNVGYGEHFLVRAVFNYLSMANLIDFINKISAFNQTNLGYGAIATVIPEYSISFWNNFKNQPEIIFYLIQEILYHEAYLDLRKEVGDRGNTLRDALGKGAVTLDRLKHHFAEESSLNRFVRNNSILLPIKYSDLNLTSLIASGKDYTKEILIMLKKIKRSDFNPWTIGMTEKKLKINIPE